MAMQSVWYYTDLPVDIIEIIERDLTETFDVRMEDSRLGGDNLNKDSELLFFLREKIFLTFSLICLFTK